MSTLFSCIGTTLALADFASAVSGPFLSTVDGSASEADDILDLDALLKPMRSLTAALLRRDSDGRSMNEVLGKESEELIADANASENEDSLWTILLKHKYRNLERLNGEDADGYISRDDLGVLRSLLLPLIQTRLRYWGELPSEMVNFAAQRAILESLGLLTTSELSRVNRAFRSISSKEEDNLHSQIDTPLREIEALDEVLSSVKKTSLRVSELFGMNDAVDQEAEETDPLDDLLAVRLVQFVSQLPIVRLTALKNDIKADVVEAVIGRKKMAIATLSGGILGSLIPDVNPPGLIEDSGAHGSDGGAHSASGDQADKGDHATEGDHSVQHTPLEEGGDHESGDHATEGDHSVQHTPLEESGDHGSGDRHSTLVDDVVSVMDEASTSVRAALPFLSPSVLPHDGGPQHSLSPEPVGIAGSPESDLFIEEGDGTAEPLQLYSSEAPDSISMSDLSSEQSILSPLLDVPALSEATVLILEDVPSAAVTRAFPRDEAVVEESLEGVSLRELGLKLIILDGVAPADMVRRRLLALEFLQKLPGVKETQDVLEVIGRLREEGLVEADSVVYMIEDLILVYFRLIEWSDTSFVELPVASFATRSLELSLAPEVETYCGYFACSDGDLDDEGTRAFVD